MNQHPSIGGQDEEWANETIPRNIELTQNQQVLSNPGIPTTQYSAGLRAAVGLSSDQNIRVRGADHKKAINLQNQREGASPDLNISNSDDLPGLSNLKKDLISGSLKEEANGTINQKERTTLQ